MIVNLFTINRLAVLVALAASPALAVAQTIALTSTQPAALARAVPRASAVTLTFSRPLAAASADALQVFSYLRGGRLGGTRTVSNNVLTLQPARDFRPGETLWATATAGAQSTAGAPLAQPRVWQFTAAAVGGTGALGGTTDVMGPSNPYAVVAADVDNDGDADLLSANSTGFNVTLFRNDGLANFTAGGSFATPNSYSPYSLAVGDIDNDGDLDVVAGARTSPGAVSGVGVLCVRLNNGSGTFFGSANLAVTQEVYSVALGDIDGDGDLDLLAGFGGTSTGVQVRLNNGSGTFGSPVTLALPAEPVRLRLGDVDNDGDLDMLASTYNGGEVSIRFNNGQGTFSGSARIATGFYNTGLALTDFDLDGDLDAVVSTSNYQGISLYANDGAGNFALYVRLATVGGPSSVTAADLNGDGAPDVMSTGNDRVEVFLNNGTGGFGPRLNSSYINFGPRDLAVADLDGDGDLDVATANDISNRLSVRLNGGTGAPLAQRESMLPAAALVLSPVPAHPTDAVWVQQLPADATTLTVHDALGRTIRTMALAARVSTEAALPLAGLAPGLYTVRAGRAVARLVVN